MIHNLRIEANYTIDPAQNSSNQWRPHRSSQNNIRPVKNNSRSGRSSQLVDSSADNKSKQPNRKCPNPTPDWAFCFSVSQGLLLIAFAKLIANDAGLSDIRITQFIGIHFQKLSLAFHLPTRRNSD